MPKSSKVSSLERRLKNRLKLATSFLFYVTLYRKGRIMPNQKQFLSFFYNDYRIRVVVDSNNELLFCLIDICNALKWYQNSVKSVANKIKAEFQISTLPTYRFKTLSGVRRSIMIRKNWLEFILTCIRETYKAKEFTQWLDAEVLPNIKNCNLENLEQNSQLQAIPQPPKTYGEALLEAGRLALENERLLTQAKENQLKIEVFDELISIYNDFTERVNKTLEKLVENGSIYQKR